MMSVVLPVAAFFFIAFILNDIFFSPFAVDNYVSMVFFPSGVRIVAVLVFDFLGAAGITLGSFLISLAYLGQSDLVIAICTAFIAGGSALLCRFVSFKLFDIDNDLQNISLIKIFKICITFSVLSSLFHQIFFVTYGMGMRNELWVNFLKMFIGDFSGAIIFLVFIKYFFSFVRYFD